MEPANLHETIPVKCACNQGFLIPAFFFIRPNKMEQDGKCDKIQSWKIPQIRTCCKQSGLENVQNNTDKHQNCGNNWRDAG